MQRYNEYILDFLNKQSLNDINKIVAPLLITYINNNDSKNKDLLKEFTIKEIGDPSLNNKWSPGKDFTNIERKRLIEAKSIVNQWITEQFIEMFFTKMADNIDDDRYQFWKKYLKHIRSFKIFGTDENYNMLKRDERTDLYVDSRFSFIKGKVSAFAFVVKDMTLV